MGGHTLDLTSTDAAALITAFQERNTMCERVGLVLVWAHYAPNPETPGEYRIYARWKK